MKKIILTALLSVTLLSSTQAMIQPIDPGYGYQALLTHQATGNTITVRASTLQKCFLLVQQQLNNNANYRVVSQCRATIWDL